MSNQQPRAKSKDLVECLGAEYRDLPATSQATLLHAQLPIWLANEIKFIEENIQALDAVSPEFQIVYTRMQSELNTLRDILTTLQETK